MSSPFLDLTNANTRRLQALHLHAYAGMLKWVALASFVAITPVLYDLIASNVAALIMMAYHFVAQNAATTWHVLWLVVALGAGLVEACCDVAYDAELDRQLEANAAMWRAILTPPPSQPQAPPLARGDGE